MNPSQRKEPCIPAPTGCCATGDSFVRAPDAWLQSQGADVTDSADESATEDWNACVGAGGSLFPAALAQRHDSRRDGRWR